ncbi:hypothetical protein PEC18_14195 [Paucibacter sp. O1-1]|nr:hypothetical protein [Paucibacter sp. O1-1]MDA3826969.1 hypothetical protein [Paucibacter sp. O1-1]
MRQRQEVQGLPRQAELSAADPYRVGNCADLRIFKLAPRARG